VKPTVKHLVLQSRDYRKYSHVGVELRSGTDDLMTKGGGEEDGCT